MNVLRLILSIVAVAAAFYLFDFLFHGMIYGQAYKDTAEAWRPESEMMARIPFQILCYFVIATGFCFVWAIGFPRGGIKAGATVGFLMGFMATGGMLLNFVFLPIPDQFKLPWTVGGILSGVVGGVVASLVYKPRPSA